MTDRSALDRRTLLALYDSMEQAAATVSAIIAAHIIPCTLEFLDQKTLRCVEDFAKVGLPRDAAAILLVETDGHPAAVADEATKIEELCRTHGATSVRRAANALDTRHPNATQYCAMAKRFATDAGFEVANQALQLHGGYGYLNDYPLERWVRDSRVHQILEGTNEIMRVITARRLLEQGGMLDNLL